MKTTVMSCTSRNLRFLREDSCCTQEQLADFLGITISDYSKYENGMVMIPSEVAVLLSDYFQVDVQWLTTSHLGSGLTPAKMAHYGYQFEKKIYDTIKGLSPYHRGVLLAYAEDLLAVEKGQI